MRSKRTVAENRIIGRLSAPLKTLKFDEYEIDPDIFDRPDAVVVSGNRKVGIEICRLDYEQHMHWRALTGEQFGSRAAEITINLEKMFAAIADKKWTKYQEYVTEHELDECWLVLHNNVFEIRELSAPGYPDKKWFEQHSRWELQDLKCPFDRVLFNLEHPDVWYFLYKKSHRILRTKKVFQWPSIIEKEVTVQIQDAGVTKIDFGNMDHEEAFE